MRAVKLSELCTRVRRRCKMEESEFISEEELRSLVTEGVTALYDRLITARGQEYYRTTAEVMTVPGRAIYVLPGDFYQLLGVVMTPGSRLTETVLDGQPEGNFTVIESAYDNPGGRWQKLAPFMVAELDHGLSASSSCEPVRYRLRGRQVESLTVPQASIELRPVPSGTHTVRIEYIPTCTSEKPQFDEPGMPSELQWDGINGWEEHVVLSVSIQILGMEESSTSHLDRALARMEERIDGLASNRDAGAPEHIVDVRGRGHHRHRHGGWGF